MVKGALHLGVELLVFEFFPGDPLGGGDQRGFALQVFDIPLA